MLQIEHFESVLSLKPVLVDISVCAGKCADSDTPAKYHPGLCSPFIHTVTFNDSVSGQ